ncbi:MAG: putative O-glycosylation ligase, exosortase A system-associated [Gammaproteobacteria bacterium]|nr:putative O-glycosylation ligase, exosortase A system-associated [Gammaproteobacteria bacterium]
MRDIILLAFVVIMALMTLKKPFYGVLMWCWISYMLPHKLMWGFMIYFPIAQFVAIVFLVAFFVSNESKKINVCAPLGWWLLFNLSMFFSAMSAYQEFGNLGSYSNAVKVQIFSVLIYMMLTSRERIEQTLWVVSLSIGYYGIKGGIFTILTAGNLRVWGPGGGYFEGNNELGLALLMIVPILYYLFRVSELKWLKYALAAAILLCLAAVLGTQSRGALVAIVAVGGFFWFKSDKKFAASILIIIMLPIGYSMMSDRWHDRMATIVQSNEESYDGSIKGRLNAWRAAYNMATANVFGANFGAFNRVNFYLYAPDPEDFHDAHSIYFKVLGQQGFPGLFLFMALWISAWRLANKVQKMVKDRQDLMWANLLCRMLQVSFVAYASGGLFLGLSYFDLPYHILITICAVYILIKKELAKPLTDQPALQGAT